jgi:DNA-binding response OmpR family regulator
VSCIRILIIEDTPDIRMMIVAALASGPYEIAEADSGEAGLAIAGSMRPEIVLLDLGLPDMDGLDVCRTLKSTTGAYVIVLSGRDTSVDAVTGPNVGADDHIMKPFSPKKLDAQIRAASRRVRSATPISHEATIDGVVVRLRPDEFDVLSVLREAASEGATRSQIVAAVWGAGRGADDALVDECVASLHARCIDQRATSQLIETTADGYRIRMDACITS